MRSCCMGVGISIFRQKYVDPFRVIEEGLFIGPEEMKMITKIKTFFNDIYDFTHDPFFPTFRWYNPKDVYELLQFVFAKD